MHLSLDEDASVWAWWYLKMFVWCNSTDHRKKPTKQTFYYFEFCYEQQGTIYFVIILFGSDTNPHFYLMYNKYEKYLKNQIMQSWNSKIKTVHFYTIRVFSCICLNWHHKNLSSSFRRQNCTLLDYLSADHYTLGLS